MDYHDLNKIMKPDIYPLPLVTNILSKLKGAKQFRKLDLRLGYNNVRIQKGNEHLAAFNTPAGMFELLVMFFGL